MLTIKYLIKSLVTQNKSKYDKGMKKMDDVVE